MKPRVSTHTLGAIVLIAVAVLASGLLLLRPKDKASQAREEDERYSASLGIYNYYRPDESGFRHDKVELEQRYRDVVEEASRRAEQEMPDHRGMGRFYIFESTKKRILKEDYGIEWRTTAEMNPEVIID
jgi:hypothetical protein